jgi:molybdate transport system substrate-binding protein
VSRRLLGILLASLALAPAGCAADQGAGADRGGDADCRAARLTVSAAASLKAAFEDYGAGFQAAEPRFAFAGSDELAAQIRSGVRPDVYAAANTRLPRALHREGLVERPVTFAANRLVVAVPTDSRVRSLDDLAEPGTTLAIGAPGVPIGSYTRDVLGRLDARPRRAILRNVRSNEPDVSGITGKLTQGAVDAGFLYVTDVAAAGGALRAIDLPRTLQPRVEYGIAVVRGGTNPNAARAFVQGLLEGEGARALREAGFEPPPGV